jgi:protein-tyrosine-phosphatase
VLEEHGENVEGLRSKDWKEFAGPEAPPLDFVFTVCSRAAAEECPVWPGQPMTAPWGIEDPAGVEGDAERRQAFTKAYGEILTRVRLFSSLRLEQLDRLTLQREIQKIPERAKRTD